MKRVLFVLSASLLLMVASCKKDSIINDEPFKLEGTSWNMTESNPSKSYGITLNANGSTNYGGSWSVSGNQFTMNKSWYNYTGTITHTGSIGGSINGTYTTTTGSGTFYMLMR